MSATFAPPKYVSSYNMSRYLSDKESLGWLLKHQAKQGPYGVQHRTARQQEESIRLLDKHMARSTPAEALNSTRTP
jgi:hypothetical protein